jgi:hypothetical protein
MKKEKKKLAWTSWREHPVEEGLEREPLAEEKLEEQLPVRRA